MNPDLLIAALDRIPDPVTGKGLVEAKRVAAPRVREGVATLVLSLDGLPGLAVAELPAEIERAARAVPGISDVRIVKTSERRQMRFVAVASGKGGVGKSTVAANLAVALARQGHTPGLIDADIHGPSVPTLLGQKHSRATAIDKRLQPIEAFGVKALSIGFLVDPDRAIAWRGPMVAGALQQMITDADWGNSDPIILDLPPGTGDIQLSIIQKHRPAGAVIVSTPQDLALIDAKRAIDLFRQTDVPIIGLVENMSGYVCPHCGEVSNPFGRGGAEDICAALSVPFLGRVPLDIAIRESSDAGLPVAAGDGPQAEAFHAIARKVAAYLGD